jgi:xanthine/uracil permease
MLLLVAPACLPVWAALTYGVESGRGLLAFGWASGVLTLLAAVIVVWAILCLRRWRRAWWTALPVVLGVIVVTFLAWFIGAMAIVNDWV